MVPCVSHGSLMWVFLNGEWFSPESDSTPPTFGTQRACQVASKWGKYGETPSASEIAFIPGGKSFGKFYACPNQSPLFQTFVHILSPYSEPSIVSIVFRLLCMVCKALPEHPTPNIVAPCSYPVSWSTCDLLERRNCSCWFCVFNAWHATGPNKLF